MLALVVNEKVVFMGKVLKSVDVVALLHLIMCKKKIAFIYVHNSCRSQIAEALGKYLARDKFDFDSAETETKPQINQDAVWLMKEIYGIDMESSQCSKTADKIPIPDIAISMECDVGYPYVVRIFDNDWKLDDPKE